MNFYEPFTLPLPKMGTSFSYTVDNIGLQTLILPSIQNLKQNNKKCGTKEVFQLVLKFLESGIDKEFFDNILEFLIKNQKVKARYYGN